jgi:transmembrane sensor
MTNKKKKDFMEMNTEEQINERISQFQVPYTHGKEEALLLLKAKINAQNYNFPDQKKILFQPIYWISGIAATLLILLGTWYLFLHNPTCEIVAGRGQHTDIHLPDGSKVNLNAESKISYNKKNFITKRDLTMDGEAFFQVQKGQTFTIHTKYADIRILGTSFNVLARKNSFKVSCVTGKVQVSNVGNSVIITPGECASMEGDHLSKFSDKNIETVSLWKNGEFSFENTQLNLIFNEIERQFNITFVSKLPLDKMHFTGSFSNKNLANALDIVCIPMGLTYEIGRNDKVFIKEKKE